MLWQGTAEGRYCSLNIGL